MKSPRRSIFTDERATCQLNLRPSSLLSPDLLIEVEATAIVGDQL